MKILADENKTLLNHDERVQAKFGIDKGSATYIEFGFEFIKTFSMIRIWNFNGQRVHSNIGMKFCLLKLDEEPLFMGEIRKS
jgi:hypothetical protein